MDVEICETTLAGQRAHYEALACRLPPNAVWLVTPLRRTQRTAAAIRAISGADGAMHIEPGLIEQDLGKWQGLPHDSLPAHLQEPAHAFWPLGATETPPGGESMHQVLLRVGHTLDRLARDHAGQEIVAISHGGAIRAALAHASGMGANAALHFSVHNLSLTVLERHAVGWRVAGVNESFG